ncbi:hypothetical protein [Melghirimyces algeriensis]|uniref:Formiminotetrahydrofolate cyclodeaminase n=1 Tax=Melghirimyces algeriensis TaxID=910412 RepID=A0A521EHE7_9BACL|nr:hypothetical protein [Melghirimyces algeriensis]SMO83336.1 hypothetical protein SAMN06264849_10960 [Melghirimyces algeriensis]
MNHFATLPLSEFADHMAERKLPSPAAGSSLAVSLMMACSLLELTISSLAEKGEVAGKRSPSSDLAQLSAWRKEGEELVEADIRVVETMLREPETAKADVLLRPVRRLHEIAKEILAIIPDYLAVSGSKASDTLTACLHLRTVLVSSVHIARFNAQAFGWPDPLSNGWEEVLTQTDQLIKEAIQLVDISDERGAESPSAKEKE